MATLNVDVVASKSGKRLLEAAARAGRIATLRELAADLNARADVLEAAGRVDRKQVLDEMVEEAGKYDLYSSTSAPLDRLCAGSCCEDC